MASEGNNGQAGASGDGVGLLLSNKGAFEWKTSLGPSGTFLVGYFSLLLDHFRQLGDLDFLSYSVCLTLPPV
jgi:hypothetical protein